MDENSSPKKTQLDLDIERDYQKDRNFSKGGRSFYFFDFDDNVAFLSTPIFIFHKKTAKELALNSGEFARSHRTIGKIGEYRDYVVDFEDSVNGSFRNFRDREFSREERKSGKRQMFVEDLERALCEPDFEWKGPSWNCFYHAVFNHRPTAIITARGHSPMTIQQGIGLMVDQGHLPNQPNYLGIFPVSHTETRAELGDADNALSVAELKKRAIRASVEMAFVRYQKNPYHRFGMSDDDPKNVELIIEAMKELKADYPDNSFFCFDSSGGELLRREVFVNKVDSRRVEASSQMSFF